MSRFLLATLTLLLFPLLALAGDPLKSALADLPNVSFPASERVASGRLHNSDITALKRAGITQVIDLSVDSETPDFDEAAAMRAAGITYHNLPIGGTDDLTREAVTQFDQWLGAAGDQPTLVHCASSNRVGAMIALRAAMINGMPTDAALAEGRRWGLKSLEPAVRKQLQAWSTACMTADGASGTLAACP